MATWRVAEAKAKFSAVLDKAETEGPQLVTRRKREFFLVTKEQWAETTGKTGTEVEKPFVSAWDVLRPPPEMRFDYDFPQMRGKARAAKF